MPSILERREAAIRTLDGFSDDTIQGFLIYAHSIELLNSRARVPNNGSSLSREQLDAIKLLKDCPCDAFLSSRSKRAQTGI